MNTYSLRAKYYDDGVDTLGFVAGDAAAATRLCAAIGHLWLGSKQIRSGSSGIPVSEKVGFSSFDKGAITELDFMTPYLLPSSIDVKGGQPYTGYTADASVIMGLAVQDDAMSNRMNNVGNTIVIAGALVVAITEGGVDISSQLSTQMRIPVGYDANGLQYLVLGFANTSAQDGVYPNPFTTALAFWSGGTGSQRNVPIMVTNGGQKMLR